MKKGYSSKLMDINVVVYTTNWQLKRYSLPLYTLCMKKQRH